MYWVVDMSDRFVILSHYLSTEARRVGRRTWVPLLRFLLTDPISKQRFWALPATDPLKQLVIAHLQEEAMTSFDHVTTETAWLLRELNAEEIGVWVLHAEDAEIWEYLATKNVPAHLLPLTPMEAKTPVYAACLRNRPKLLDVYSRDNAGVLERRYRPVGIGHVAETSLFVCLCEALVAGGVFATESMLYLYQHGVAFAEETVSVFAWAGYIHCILEERVEAERSADVADPWAALLHRMVSILEESVRKLSPEEKDVFGFRNEHRWCCFWVPECPVFFTVLRRLARILHTVRPHSRDYYRQLRFLFLLSNTEPRYLGYYRALAEDLLQHVAKHHRSALTQNPSPAYFGPVETDLVQLLFYPAPSPAIRDYRDQLVDICRAEGLLDVDEDGVLQYTILDPDVRHTLEAKGDRVPPSSFRRPMRIWCMCSNSFSVDCSVCRPDKDI